MLAGRRVHGHEERHVVDAAGQVRQGVGHPAAALAVLPPGPRALAAPAGRRDGAAGDAEVHGLAVPADQLGLVVERVALAGAAEHEELDDRLRPGRVMRPCRLLGRRAGQQALFVQKRTITATVPRPAPELLQEIAAGRRSGLALRAQHRHGKLPSAFSRPPPKGGGIAMGYFPGIPQPFGCGRDSQSTNIDSLVSKKTWANCCQGDSCERSGPARRP